MVTPLDVLGATASALQIVGMICSLGNRILDKPKDAKSLRMICTDAKRYALVLKQWEIEMKNEVKEACVILREELESIVEEIEGLKARKALVKAREFLKLYKSEFREQFADALEEFQFRMSIESQRSVEEMDRKLRNMEKEIENLMITSKTLETLPNMEISISTVEEKMRSISHEMRRLMGAIQRVESLLNQLEMNPSPTLRLESVIMADGNATREEIRKSTVAIEKLAELLHMNDSASKIQSEIITRSSGLRWLDDSEDRTIRVCSLKEGPNKSRTLHPTATFNGVALSSVRIRQAYDKVLTTPHIAAELDEHIQEIKRERVSDISPYIGLATRGPWLEELREYVSPRVNELLEKHLSREHKIQAMQLARALSQEYRCANFSQIIELKAYTIPKLSLLEEMERAMLALQVGKLKVSFSFGLNENFDGDSFVYSVQIEMARYVS